MNAVKLGYAVDFTVTDAGVRVRVTFPNGMYVEQDFVAVDGGMVELRADSKEGGSNGHKIHSITW